MLCCCGSLKVENTCGFTRVTATYSTHAAPFKGIKGYRQISSRMRNFLLQLKGMFRRLPADLQRDQDLLLQAIQHMWEEAGGDDLEFAQRCIKAAVSNVGDSVINKRQRGEDAEVDVNSDQVHWRFHAAKMVLQLKARLVREISEGAIELYGGMVRDTKNQFGRLLFRGLLH